MSENTRKAVGYLDDLQNLTAWAKSAQWRMRQQKKQTGENPHVDFYKVVDADGKMVFTVAFQANDHMTRILVEALLTKNNALVAGASLTMQMYQHSEELAECQGMKERDGITDAYNDRQQTAWRKMRELLQQIRVHLGKFATARDLKP